MRISMPLLTAMIRTIPQMKYTENTTPVAPPDQEEVAMAIQRLKFNKASGYDVASLLNFLKQEEMS